MSGFYDLNANDCTLRCCQCMSYFLCPFYTHFGAIFMILLRDYHLLMVKFAVFVFVMLEIESVIGQIVRIELILLTASHGCNTSILFFVAKVLFNNVE